MTHHFRFGAISPEPLDFSALQMKADSDPVGLLCRCRKRYKAIAQGTRQLHWELLVACYAGALGIRKRPELFKDLLEHDFFKQRTYAAKINDVLRLALIIGTDAEGTGPTYKNACYVAARLQLPSDNYDERCATTRMSGRRAGGGRAEPDQSQRAD